MNNQNRITCIIVDDELSSQKVLQHFVSETEVLELKQTCSNAAEAFKYLQLNSAVDLLFLDINMPKQTGLDFYKSLQHPPAVIFTTAYPQYAVEGFEVNATDYLLKPIAYERFLTAINKVLNEKALQPKQDFLILKENKALHKVFFSDIAVIEAFGDYVKVHLADKTIVTHSTFSGFIEQLPTHFIRVHKSFSINLNKMEQLSGNQIQISGHKIPIGQTYKSKVLKALDL
ncbi:LytTR family two component transcriptional regulator [Winogradskyella wandonensis]|uniref:LytTR family two component transcriptional regulator n=1 Tax=Winogradskyella wandonensis TaxID=1442586 RepID=A0A4R1KWU9_9FLAO|nr:LytTR family DNA-binding domain-containing protein [Winogradskyella wandonensis]TCK69123.1 LytTR family two component transcriptional regulator [Winogradskyella wandonensis]